MDDTGLFIAEYHSRYIADAKQRSLFTDYGFEPNDPIIAGDCVCMNVYRRKSDYEYRAGMCIPGTVGKTGFEPVVGGIIRDLHDVFKEIGKENIFPVRKIYNLPGVVNRISISSTRNTELQIKTITQPPEPDLANSVRLRSEKWLFISEANTKAHLARKDCIIFGRIDEYGNFIGDFNSSKVDVIKRDELYREYLFNEPWQMPVVINKSGHKSRALYGNIGPCYEYRNGKLIPGVLRGLDFVPYLGGKVIDFKDYQPSSQSSPIYNLPGKFVSIQIDQ